MLPESSTLYAMFLASSTQICKLREVVIFSREYSRKVSLYNTSPLKLMTHVSATKSFCWLGFPLGSSWVARSVLWNRYVVLPLTWFCMPSRLRRIPYFRWQVGREVRNNVHCLARFVVLLSCVAWLQLFPVSSPNWSVRNNFDVEAAGPQCFLDDSWYPSRMSVSAGSIVQCIHRISGFVPSGHLANAR